MALSKQDIQMFNEQFQRVIDSTDSQFAALRADLVDIKQDIKTINSSLHDTVGELKDINAVLRMHDSAIKWHEKRIFKLEPQQ